MGLVDSFQVGINSVLRWSEKKFNSFFEEMVPGDGFDIGLGPTIIVRTRIVRIGSGVCCQSQNFSMCAVTQFVD